MWRRIGGARCRRLTVLAAAALLCAPASAWARGWVRIETPNFIVYGEPSEKRLREVADEFERFREALGRVVQGAATRAAVPTIVVVFNSQRSFAPYRPRYQGKPVALEGFFVSASHQNLVALTLENREHALRTIFHEYAHIVISGVARNVPVWLGEGLAEYYSTFAVEDEGRTAIVARPILEHLVLLNQERLIPHEELINVDSSSSLYNEGNRRGVFYAQSWALVHMLTQGDPDRSKQLEQYLARTATGTPADVAWREIFGDINVNAALKRHIGRLVMRAYRYRFEQEIATVRGAASVPSEGDVQATLADLLYNLDFHDDGAQRLEEAVVRTPISARAQALLGLVRLDQQRSDEANRLLFAAAANRTDWLVQYHVATGLARLLEQADTAERTRIAAAAVSALETVLAARPDLPHALALRAIISVEAGRDLEAGLRAITRARMLAPGREDYVFEEARLLVEQREFAKARTVLGPLMSSRYHTDVREHARRVMSEIVRMETSGPARGKPVFRTLLDGEHRTEGDLEQIECSASGVILHVRAGDGLERFTARSLDVIELITYRTDLQGPISCQRRVPPDRVYITWRPAESGFATVVAVEFLPI